MARSLRIERADGVYHIINRGNYRQDLFINDGAHQLFEDCLFEACEKCGWALGSKDFKRELVKSEGLLKEGSVEAIRMEGKDLREVNELMWEALLSDGLASAGKGADSIANDRKSAYWKIKIAAELKGRTSAPSTWIAQHLNMGSPQLVGSYVKRFKAGELREDPESVR